MTMTTTRFNEATALSRGSPDAPADGGKPEGELQ